MNPHRHTLVDVFFDSHVTGAPICCI